MEVVYAQDKRCNHREVAVYPAMESSHLNASRFIGGKSSVFSGVGDHTPLWLAPMAGVTDKPFRTLVQEQGCDLAFTEMISAKAIAHKNPKTWLLLDIKNEPPIGVQLFGSCPLVMAEAAQVAVEEGASLIDINMGCPVPKVVNNGEGAALMRNPPLAEEIVRRVVMAVPVPVTVKIRAGWDSLSAPTLAARLVSAGVSAITIHARTRMQMYSGQADWEIITQVVQAVDVPIIGNGDTWSGGDARAMREQTGCAGVMVARGSLGNPWLFAEAKASLEGREHQPPTLKERIEMALRHFDMELSYRGQDRGMLFMRKHLAWYLKGLPGAAALKREIFTSSCPSDIKDMLLNYATNNC